MGDVLKFASENPWLTAFILMLAFILAWQVFFELPNRVVRHFNIKKAGWPPPQLDADGDFKKQDEEDEEGEGD